MTAPPDHRYAIRSAVLTGLRNHPDLADVQVEPAWPGAKTQRQSVFIDGSATSTENGVPVTVGSGVPVVFEDRWSFWIGYSVIVRGTISDALDDLGVLVAAGTDVLRHARTQITPPNTGGLQTVSIVPSARVDDVAYTENGVWCWTRQEVRVHSRINTGV